MIGHGMDLESNDRCFDGESGPDHVHVPSAVVSSERNVAVISLISFVSANKNKC